MTPDLVEAVVEHLDWLRRTGTPTGPPRPEHPTGTGQPTTTNAPPAGGIKRLLQDRG
jgi:hypothetical protein